MSTILDFYDGGRDLHGRTLVEILHWDDEALERRHDFIQWLFPLAEPSAAVPGSPVLNCDDVWAFRQSVERQQRLLSAFERILTFYGLELRPSPLAVNRADVFTSRARSWLTPHNHNFLRLTRILRSLRLLGLEAYSEALLKALGDIYIDHAATIGPVTLRYWQATTEDA